MAPALFFFSNRIELISGRYQCAHNTNKWHVGNGIGGWGAELNREIVSCRACVRAVCMSSEFGAKKCGRLLSLFPFRLWRFSLFPLPAKVLSSFSWLYRYISSCAIKILFHGVPRDNVLVSCLLLQKSIHTSYNSRPRNTTMPVSMKDWIHITWYRAHWM